MRKIAINISKLTKIYQLHHEKPTLVEEILLFGKKQKFVAISDMSLKIYKGERIGIIGQNGAGKTTLLKIITGISSPNFGRVKTNGKVVSLIELGSGFHADLVGRENIYLNGLLLGMNKAEIDNKINKIIAFADIGDFIDAPLYTYSNGMKLRLGFAIAIHSEPDILILDEGFTAGDQDFREKCEARLANFFKSGKTVIMVSHWLEYLKKNCDRIIWMESGKIISDGGVAVIDDYLSNESTNNS